MNHIIPRKSNYNAIPDGQRPNQEKQYSVIHSENEQRQALIVFTHRYSSDSFHFQMANLLEFQLNSTISMQMRMKTFVCVFRLSELLAKNDCVIIKMVCRWDKTRLPSHDLWPYVVPYTRIASIYMSTTSHTNKIPNFGSISRINQ